MIDELSLDVNGLTKKFGRFTAVNKVTFEVYKGEIFGFLGANGAGKSTTIRMLCGILEPTEGDAVVGGYNVIKEPEKVKQSIGYMSQKFSLYEDLTVHENLEFYGGIYGVEEKELARRINWALEVSELTGKDNILAGELAGGWKQRLALSSALLHNPKIVFLDEPTSGVDPVSRRNFWNLIQNVAGEGVTVFVTTHYLEEAEYCHRLAFIYNGEIIVKGAPSSIKKDVLKRKVFEIESSEPVSLIEKLEKADFVDDISIFGLKVHIITTEEQFEKSKIIDFMKTENIDFKQVDDIIPSLEDVFIELIKIKRKDEQNSGNNN